MATLRDVLEVLGPVLTTSATELTAEVEEVVLVGPGDPLPSSPGALLVITSPVEGSVKAAGVVVKGVAPDVGVPVLVADDDLPWNQLLHLLISATSASGSTGAIGDLFTLANSVAAMVGGATTIEDPARRILAYSSLPDQPIDEARRQGILGRQVPFLTRNDAIYRDLQRGNGVLRVPADGDVLPRLAVAVRAGAEVLGSIWVIDTGTTSEQALLDAGRLAALHLLRARAGSEVERRARGELLRGLLDGRSSPEIAATRLGFEVTTPVTVLGFALPAGTDELDEESVADIVQLQCAAVRPRSSVVVQLGTVYALVPSLPRPDLAKLARTVVDRARVPLAGAVGSTVPGVADVVRSRVDVDAVLHLAAPGSVAAVEDVLPQVVLLHLQSHLSGQPHLRLPQVVRMLSHDAQHETPYGESVLAYLAANADVPAAAESVNVHPNTFRYRLRRVRELFDLDLEDPDVRLVVWLQLRAPPVMLAALEELVSCESPSSSLEATREACEVFARLAADVLGEPTRIEVSGRTHLRYSFGAPRVLVLGHLDTVWPLGTLARWPFSVDGDVATGPGVFDMKAGVVQALSALSRLPSLDGVCLLLNTDEEIGSPTSRDLILDTVAGCSAALVCEPAAGLAVKTARKGISMYDVTVTGRAAHAGLEPWNGVNAGVGLAHAVLQLSTLGAGETTVTPTVLSAGTTTNTVPASATVAVDVRAAEPAELLRVDDAVRALAVPVGDVTVTGGINRPPLDPSSSASLFALASRLSPGLQGIAVGGGSDGNFTAGAGIPTLDGLGAVGNGAHAEGEHVLVSHMEPRAALLASLLSELLA